MSERPTPETDNVAQPSSLLQYETVDANFARKLERERDEAREELADWENAALHVESDHPDEVHCGCVPILRKLLADARKERDEAREDLREEKKFHNRTHSELIQTQCKLMDVTQAIIATLEGNRHLADGDDCTLAKLKSVVPEWK